VDLDEAVTAAQQGSVRAFELLYADVHPRLLRFLVARVGEDDAADVASETWLQATRDLKRFRGDAQAFRGWVVGIGRHRALDHVRARGRRPVDPWEPTALPDSALPDAGAEADQAMATRRALALIAQLPPDQAEAVLLRVVVGLDAPAAAKVLGKRPGAVRMATSRGLARLAVLREEQGVGQQGVGQQGVTPGSPAAL
jgi:RNA polymerase sigma-70 factor (ECF subfamily)